MTVVTGTASERTLTPTAEEALRAHGFTGGSSTTRGEGRTLQIPVGSP
jgi:hypothetical protein